MDPITKIERQMDAEMYRQIDIYYSAVSLALHRHWGWGRDRLSTLYGVTQRTWEECAATNQRSMVQMLEEETGIELRNEENRSWREFAFLNADHSANKRKWTRGQILAMRQGQLKWTGTNIFACILLALHRKCGFGVERISRVVNQTVEIREEYNFDRQALVDSCKEETGISIRDIDPFRE